MISAALLPHISEYTPGQGFMTSLDHSIWVHNFDFRVDQWLLFDIEAPILCELVFGWIKKWRSSQRPHAHERSHLHSGRSTGLLVRAGGTGAICEGGACEENGRR